MPAIHRNGDHRACGATTIVTGQSTVYVNGKLAAVEGDLCSHGGGALIANNNSSKIFINGKLVITLGATATADDLGHTNTQPIEGSDTGFGLQS